MKKKITAFLTAACLCTGFGAIPAIAEYRYAMEFTFIGVHPESGSYIMIETGHFSPQTNYIRDTQMIELFGSEENFPADGSLIGLTGSYSRDEESITFSNVTLVDTIGSVFDFETVDYVYQNADTITDAEGNSCCHLIQLYQDGSHPTGALPNPADAQKGDTLRMAVNEYGKPIVCVDVIPLGDVNADGTLNILDVILLNKAVLIGEPIPALETAARSGETDYGQCDFNGNGMLDLDDSLGMMKRIIGIEETE